MISLISVGGADSFRQIDSYSPRNVISRGGEEDLMAARSPLPCNISRQPPRVMQSTNIEQELLRYARASCNRESTIS